MSVSNGQLANASTFNNAFVSKSANSTVSGTITQDKESVLKEIATPATPSSGYGKIYFKSDGKLYQLNDAGIETQVGSGAGGGGGVNFISNGTAEDNNTTGWAVYADAAGTSPVDGTGGTANVTIATTSTTPLAGTYSFLMAKDAVNRQGQGWSYAFTIDSTYQAKVLQISFDYLINSGTFVAGSSSTTSDVTVWIYDVTNAVLIQPSNIKLFSNSSSLTDKFQASFQSASNSTSYRLIFHVQSTSASAYTLEVDNVSVSPSQYVYGTPVTDWQSYTPTGSWTSNTTYTGKWRKVGDSVELDITLSLTGAPNSTTLTINYLPSGMALDTAKMSLSNSYARLGWANGKGGATAYNLIPIWNNSTSIYLTYQNSLTGAEATINQSAPVTWASGDNLHCRLMVPIAGWSSSVQTSDSADTRVMATVLTHSAQSISNNTNTQLTGFTVVTDTHGAYSSNQVIVPVAGVYGITGYGYWSANATNARRFFYRIDGGAWVQLDEKVASSAINVYNNGFVMVSLNAGQTVQFGVWHNSGGTETFTGFRFSVNRLSGPSAIAASESVNAKYFKTATQTFSTETKLTGYTRIFDSHNAWDSSNNLYRFPISGKYLLEIQNNAPAIGLTQCAAYRVNGVATTFYIGTDSAANNQARFGGSTLVTANAGDYIEIYHFTNGSVTIQANEQHTHFSITRVGN